MDLGYAVVCPTAYVFAGATKFVVNSLSAKRLAFDLMGLGGFPSTHTSIVSAPAWLIAIKEGVSTPAFAVALGLLLVVIIDAMDLRRKVERVNRILRAELPGSPAAQRLRDRISHTPLEVAGGVLVGGMVAYFGSML
jgi:acid phosphatase family membrane protein YuiD